MPSGGSLITPSADAHAGQGTSAGDESEEALLRQAMALSRGGVDEDVEMGADDSTGNARATVAGADGEDEEMTEEEAIARAIEMSMQDGEGQDGQSKK